MRTHKHKYIQTYTHLVAARDFEASERRCSLEKGETHFREVFAAPKIEARQFRGAFRHFQDGGIRHAELANADRGEERIR